MSTKNLNETISANKRLLKKIDRSLANGAVVKTTATVNKTEKKKFQPEPGSVADGVMKNAINRDKGDKKFITNKYKK